MLYFIIFRTFVENIKFENNIKMNCRILNQLSIDNK